MDDDLINDRDADEGVDPHDKDFDALAGGEDDFKDYEDDGDDPDSRYT